MNRKKLLTLVTAGLLLIGGGLGIFALFQRERTADTAQTEQSTKIYQPNPAREKIASSKGPVQSGPHLVRKSKAEWLEWLNKDAKFRIVRESDAFDIFECDASEFKKIGLGDVAYGVTVTIINEWAREFMATTNLSNLPPEHVKSNVVEKEHQPHLISETSGSSTFLFKTYPTKSEADVQRRQNRANRFLERMEVYLVEQKEHLEELRNAGPQWGQAVLEWCLAQPALRRFGNSELTVTFEDIEVEGKKAFRVTESMAGINGGPPIVNQFTSPDLPGPYNRYFLSD